MADVKSLLDEATSKLKAEAARLRAQIDEKERALEDELAPIRGQLAELDDAITRIEGKPAPASARKTGRAPRGHNRQLILDYLSTNPAAKPTEVARATNISKATVYATLAKLVHDGLLVKTEGTDGPKYATTEPAGRRKPSR